MEIFGIGAPELIFVIIIALIVLGPRDMQKAGKTIGGWLNKLIRSDGWKAFQQTSREIRNLPTNLMREANLELAETERELRKATDFRSTPPTSSPNRVPPQSQGAENSIQPPAANRPKAQADPEPPAEASVGGKEAENFTPSEPPSANPPESQSTTESNSEGDVDQKPAVSTTDQNA